MMLRISAATFAVVVLLMPGTLHSDWNVELFSEIEGLHSFAGDPSPDFNHGATSRWLFSGIHLQGSSEPSSLFQYSVDSTAALNLGSAEMPRPAMPSPTDNPFRTEERKPAPEKETNADSPINLRILELYAGMLQRMPDILAFFAGPSARPTVKIVLGRWNWKTNTERWLMARPGSFAGLHALWDTDGYGRLMFSPGYLLDGADAPSAPLDSPSRAYQDSSLALSSSALDANRYGSSAFYILGNTIQFGLGVRNHSMRSDSRLYQAGHLNYLQAFLGVNLDRLSLGLGYSRSRGNLQRPRKTVQEIRKLEMEDEFQDSEGSGYELQPRSGGNRKQRSTDVSGAEVHAFLQWKGPFSLTLFVFYPEASYLSEEQREREQEEEIGYVHPGGPPASLPLTRRYEIVSSPSLCSSANGPHCPGVASGSKSHARIMLLSGLSWQEYRINAGMVYSMAVKQIGNGISNTAPDPQSPDYLEIQLQLRKTLEHSEYSAELIAQYGRIYIRKTRPSRAFAEYLRLGVNVQLCCS